MLKKLSTFIDNKSNNIQSNEYKNSKVSDSFDFLSLIRSWPEIAGAKLSEHTIPLKNQNGKLLILSNHSAFANELSFMELPLKKKIFDKFPGLSNSIFSLKFIVDTTHFQEHYKRFAMPEIESKQQYSLHPHSPEFKNLKKEAQLFFEQIEDGELKEKMISIYIQTKCNKSK
jgi:hypothetical protein